MTHSNQLKLQAKSVHEATYGDPKDLTIKEQADKIKSLNRYISEIESAIKYCFEYDIAFDSLSSVIDEYNNRDKNDEWADDQKADQADFANKLEKEDF